MNRYAGHVDATFYAQVEPDFSQYRYATDEERPLRGAKVVGITQKRPNRPKSGTVLVRLTLRLPAAAFYPLRPEAIVVIPESMTETVPVVAIAQDPHAPADPDGGES